MTSVFEKHIEEAGRKLGRRPRNIYEALFVQGITKDAQLRRIFGQQAAEVHQELEERREELPIPLPKFRRNWVAGSLGEYRRWQALLARKRR